jgi:hypothetical protein
MTLSLSATIHFTTAHRRATVITMPFKQDSIDRGTVNRLNLNCGMIDTELLAHLMSLNQNIAYLRSLNNIFKKSKQTKTQHVID